MIIVIYVLQAVLVAAWVTLLARVLMSWIDPGFNRPVSRTLYRLTEPVLGPVRNVLPKTGQLDLAPLVILLGLGFAMRVVLSW